MLIIVEPRGQRAGRSEAEGRGLYDAMLAYGRDLKEKGLLLASESLRPDEHTVRISATEGKTQLLDGPFAEAKEMVGGFYLPDVSSKHEAVAIAQGCPAVNWATVDVRECAPCYVS